MDSLDFHEIPQLSHMPIPAAPEAYQHFKIKYLSSEVLTLKYECVSVWHTTLQNYARESHHVLLF